MALVIQGWGPDSELTLGECTTFLGCIADFLICQGLLKSSSTCPERCKAGSRRCGSESSTWLLVTATTNTDDLIFALEYSVDSCCLDFGSA